MARPKRRGGGVMIIRQPDGQATTPSEQPTLHDGYMPPSAQIAMRRRNRRPCDLPPVVIEGNRRCLR